MRYKTFLLGLFIPENLANTVFIKYIIANEPHNIEENTYLHLSSDWIHKNHLRFNSTLHGDVNIDTATALHFWIIYGKGVAVRASSR